MAQATTLNDVVYQIRDAIAKTDVRQYPSRNMKVGVNVDFLGKCQDFLKVLVCYQGKIRQKEMDAALDAANSRSGYALSRLCKRSSILFSSWKRDVGLSLRVMVSHIQRKRSQWKKCLSLGSNPRSHESWLVAMYKDMPDEDVVDLGRHWQRPG